MRDAILDTEAISFEEWGFGLALHDSAVSGPVRVAFINTLRDWPPAMYIGVGDRFSGENSVDFVFEWEGVGYFSAKVSMKDVIADAINTCSFMDADEGTKTLNNLHTILAEATEAVNAAMTKDPALATD